MRKNIREDHLLYESEHSKKEFLIVLQSMIDDDSLRTCTKKTFQLLHDIISGKTKFKKEKGRPAGLSAQGFSIGLFYWDEMNKQGTMHKAAVIDAAAKFKVTTRTVENVVKEMKKWKTKGGK